MRLARSRSEPSLPTKKASYTIIHVLLFSLYLVDFETCMQRISILYAMLNPNRIPYTFLSENNVVVTCLAMLYFEKRYMLRFYEVEKRTCVFI